MKYQKPMIKHIAKIGSDMGIYLASNIFGGLINIFLIPIYIRSLGVVEFGAYGLIESTITVALILSNLGTHVAYLKCYSEKPDDSNELFWTEAITTFILAVLAGIVCNLIISSATSFLDFRIFILICLVIVVENAFQNILTDLRCRQKAGIYSVYTVIRMTLLLIFGILFVMKYNLGITGILISRLLSNGTIVGIMYLYKSLLTPVSFSWELSRQLISYGFPIFWSGLFGNLLDVSGRYVLAWTQDEVQLGYYAVITKIGNIFLLIFRQPFTLAWTSVMFQIAKMTNARFIYSLAYLYTVILSFIITIAMSVVSPWLFLIFTGDFNTTLIALFIVFMFSRFLSVNENLSSIGIYLSGRPWWLSIIHGMGLLVCIVLHLIFVPLFGSFAVVWNIAIAAIFIIIALSIISSKYYPLPYNWTLSISLLLTWLIFANKAQLASQILILLYRK